MINKELVILVLLQLFRSSTTSQLGLQSGPQKSIETSSTFKDPENFFKEHVITGTPIIFKGVAKTFPAFTKWTDEYLKSLPESESYKVFVEEGKKEDREKGSREVSFLEFLKTYKYEDVYCVDEVPEFIKEDFPLPHPIDCPFVTENLLSDNVMWFSSGGTKSVWHRDSYENMICLLRGTKEFIMANRSETDEKAQIDLQDHSSVDVENVNIENYPGFKEIQFFNVTLEAGDCMYVPWKWYHYVTSFGNNLAVNIWWSTYRTPLICPETSTKYLNQVTFRNVEDKEIPRSIAEEVHQMIYQSPELNIRDTIPIDVFLRIIGQVLEELGMTYVSDNDIVGLYNTMDDNQDNLLSYIEFDKLLTIMPKFLSRFKDEL